MWKETCKVIKPLIKEKREGSEYSTILHTPTFPNSVENTNETNETNVTLDTQWHSVLMEDVSV